MDIWNRNETMVVRGPCFLVGKQNGIIVALLVSTRVVRTTTMLPNVVGVSTGDRRAALTSSLRDARGCFVQAPRPHENAPESPCPRR